MLSPKTWHREHYRLPIIGRSRLRDVALLPERWQSGVPRPRQRRALGLRRGYWKGADEDTDRQPLMAALITYAVDGVQYVAVQVGYGGTAMGVGAMPPSSVANQV